MYFVGKICYIFDHQYLNIFKFVFIYKTCRIMFYELTMTIILDMLIYINAVLLARLVIFFITNNWIFFNVISFLRRVELCSDLLFFIF